MNLPGFPDIRPILEAMKKGPTAESRTFKVAAQSGDRLVLLHSLADKWLQDPLTKDRAEETITRHNEEYNKDGVYLLNDKTLVIRFHHNLVFLLPHLKNSLVLGCPLSQQAQRDAKQLFQGR